VVGVLSVLWFSNAIVAIFITFSIYFSAHNETDHQRFLFPITATFLLFAFFDKQGNIRCKEKMREKEIMARNAPYMGQEIKMALNNFEVSDPNQNKERT